MDDLIIKDNFPKFQQILAIICAAFLAVGSVYVGFTETMASHYSFWFYAGIAGLLVALCTILSVTIWLPKSIFMLTMDGLFPNLNNQSSLKPIFWKDVSDMNIGLSFLKIVVKSNKTVNIDLSILRYKDLKEVKARIMELCEANSIPYRNA